MNLEDQGFLLSKKKFRENANIINVFTEKHGKINGLVYGGNSRKIRNYLQIGNKIFVLYTAKNNNRIGYFKTELVEAITPKYFNDKKRSSGILSISSILNILLPEAQSNKKIYQSLNSLMSNFDLDNWIILYIYWELNLIKELGFDTDLQNLKKNEISNPDMVKASIDGIKYEIPEFIIENNIPETPSKLLIKKSLIFTRNVMTNKFFLTNNLIFPKTRIILENYFN